LSPEGAIRESRLRDGNYKHLTQIINRHDNIIKQIKNQFVNGQFQPPKFQWQKSFFDHYIRNDNDFNYHLEYIWWNPEKHSTINNFKNYPYSSYANYQNLIDFL